MHTKKEEAFSDKWTPEIEQYGFTQIPNLLIACQGHLNLKDGELITLIELLTFWFKHDGRVYPSIGRLTRFSSKGYSTIQRRLKVLEEKGFVKRSRTLGSSSTYNLVPCVVKLYNHQKVCHNLPHKRGTTSLPMRHQPKSLPTNKEYEAKRENIKKRTTPVSSILSDRYGRLHD